jgi:hypothetical protein
VDGELDERDDPVDRIGYFRQQNSVLEQLLDTSLADQILEAKNSLSNFHKSQR